MPQPHMVALAMSVVRYPCTRSTGCLRMPQLGTKVTTGPFKRKASLVWICRRLASTQKTSRARPTSSTGSGLFVRRELAIRLGSALRMLFAMVGVSFLALVPAVPHRGSAGFALTPTILGDGVMEAVELGVAHPLAVDQPLGGAAAFALAGAPIGGGGGHPVMAGVAARVVRRSVFVLLRHGGSLPYGS